MSTALSLPSASSLQAAFQASRNLLQKFLSTTIAVVSAAHAGTSDVWRLYRLSGGTDSVSPSAAKLLAHRAEAK